MENLEEVDLGRGFFVLVIVETMEDDRTRAQYFTVDTLDENTTIRSFILSAVQPQPGAHVNLYINCVSQGRIATPRSMRDMFSNMKNHNLQLVSSKDCFFFILEKKPRFFKSANWGKLLHGCY